MTARLLICCDGTPADRPGMALDTCRAFLPVGSRWTLDDRTAATVAGWTRPGAGRDLCPACTRAVTP